MDGMLFGKIAAENGVLSSGVVPGTSFALILKLLMTAIAECPVLAVLAAAEIHRAGRLGFIRGGRKTSTFVRAIAKWLTFTLTTGAPVVGFTGFDFDRIRAFLGNRGLIHGRTFGGRRVNS